MSSKYNSQGSLTTGQTIRAPPLFSPARFLPRSTHDIKGRQSLGIQDYPKEHRFGAKIVIELTRANRLFGRPLVEPKLLPLSHRMRSACSAVAVQCPPHQLHVETIDN